MRLVKKPDWELYSDNSLDSFNNASKNNVTVSPPIQGHGSAVTVIRGCLVLLFRAGLVLIQLGCIPIENVYIIILQNIVDVAVAIASFGLVGYILAFGKDVSHGAIGQGAWIVSDTADMDNAILGFSACIIATGIITTILSGRFHFVGYLLTTLLFSMFFQPIIMHWVWHELGWLHRQVVMDHVVSVKDHAGGLTIHVTAGMVGFLGSLFLGRRLMKLSDIDESSIGAESPGNTISGYITVSLGLIAFSLQAPGSTNIPANYIGLILVNNMMAMAAGALVIVIIELSCYRESFNYWISLRCMQGSIAGIVAVSSGVDVYNPAVSFVIAAFAALLFYFVSLCIRNSSIEDYCNVISIHLVCGIVGTLLAPLIDNNENPGTVITLSVGIIHFSWQLFSLSVVLLALVAIFSLHFCLLSLTGFLRNKTEEVNHRRGITAADRGPTRCCLQRLFALHSNTAYVEPGRIRKEFLSCSKPDNSLSNLDRTYESDPQINQNFSEVAKKSKLVYKVHNANDRFQRVTNHVGKSTGYSGGDDLRNHKVGNDGDNDKYIEKLVELTESVGKRFSFYELHRTKKYTSFFRNRKRNISVRSSNCLQSPECMVYDSKFNDGFVTFKMPPTDHEYMSDESISAE